MRKGKKGEALWGLALLIAGFCWGKAARARGRAGADGYRALARRLNALETYLLEAEEREEGAPAALAIGEMAAGAAWKEERGEDDL